MRLNVSNVLLGMVCFAVLVCLPRTGMAAEDADILKGLSKQEKADILERLGKLEKADILERLSKLEDLGKLDKTGLFQVKDADESNITIGGNFKFYLFDHSAGETETGEHQSTNVSAGISSLTLYYSAEISDNLSIMVAPEILVHSGATPRLGSPIEGPDPTEDPEIEFAEAHITYMLPNGLQAKAGYLKPKFTWDYGYERFWYEDYHAFYTTANPWLGSMHDVGIEFYKSLEFSGVSVPTYLYLLNGHGTGVGGDNNEGSTIMLHVQPEFREGRLKLLGSYAFGRWDVDNNYDYQRLALGVEYKHQNFTLRTEYMAGIWENRFAGEDVNPKGFYTKAFYQFNEGIQGFVGYSHMVHDFTGFFFVSSLVEEQYDTVSLGLNFKLADGATFMVNTQLIDGEREDNSAELDLVRLTMGVRVQF